MNKHLHYARIILVVIAIALVLIPIIIVSVTGNGFGELTSHALISLSILSLIGAVLIGINKQNKNRYFVKIIVSIGLLIVLISLWL